MKQRINITTLILVLSVAVCTNLLSCKENDEQVNSLAPIKLSVCVGEKLGVTRVTDVTECQNEYLDANTLVRVFIYEHNSSPYVNVTDKNNNRLIEGTQYKALPHITRNNRMQNTMDLIDHNHEPNFTSEYVDVVGIHPDPRVETTTFTSISSNPYTFTVSSDQTTVANYKKSDLMVAHELEKQKPKPVEMNLYHKMSKITITYKPGRGAPPITAAEVLNILPSVTVNFQTAEISEAMGTPSAVRFFSNEEGNNSEYTASVLVPAQPEKTVGTAFVKFYFLGGGEATYNLKNAVTLSSGKHYIYELTVNAAHVEVTNAVVAPWEYGETKERNIEI